MIIEYIAASVLIILIIYFVLIAPRIFNRPDMSRITAGGALYAHRGLHGGKVKENTAQALSDAVKHGFGIEFDIRLSSDNIPVVIHDENLLRVFGIDSEVASLNADELKNSGVPTLEEVLGIINGSVPFIAEIKADTNDISVCGYAQQILDGYKGIYCIQSFNPLVLLWYRKHRPRIIRGQLSSNFKRDGKRGNPVLNFALRHLLFNFMASPDFIAYNHNYASALSLNICRKLFGIPTAAWTIRSRHELDASRKSNEIFIFENFMPGEGSGLKIENA